MDVTITPDNLRELIVAGVDDRLTNAAPWSDGHLPVLAIRNGRAEVMAKFDADVAGLPIVYDSERLGDYTDWTGVITDEQAERLARELTEQLRAR